MRHFLILLLALLPLRVYLQEVEKAYSRFDFTPGEKPIYGSRFNPDQTGELPLGWNTTGSGELVRLRDNYWVKLGQNAIFITDNTAPFTDNFTVEFDLYLDFTYADALFPAFSFGILGTGALKANSSAVLQHLFDQNLLALDLNAGVEQNSFSRLIAYHRGSEQFNSGEKPFKPLEGLLKQIIHVSMQVQQQRFRLWINEHKLYDLPQALPQNAGLNQLFFRVFESSYTNDQAGIYISNLRVAAGIPDTRSKLLLEGKFSTTGIHFDVNTATIKPSSYGIIREVATIMKDEPAIRIRVVGHTDADGTDQDNLTLSTRRSEAVKNLLVQAFGIAEARITTEGKGETEPVADNRTVEGKAQNRRVEFIKQ